MNRYEICCTEEQTRKALELGAPIEILPNYTEFRGFPFVKCQDGNERPCVPPTAEQMIGWLEEKGIYIDIEHINNYCAMVSITDQYIGNPIVYPSKKEVILTAIDAALEYLSQKK